MKKRYELQNRSRFVGRSLLSLVVSLAVISCSDSNGPTPGPVGTWNLETVNGKALPFNLDAPGVDKLELTGETMTLDAAGRITMSTSFRLTDRGTVSEETIPDSGIYTVKGPLVTFRFDSDGSTEVGTVDGATMTLADISTAFVYRRQ